MKKLLILTLLSAFASSVLAQDFSGKIPPKTISISAPQNSLKIDENLEYSMEWIGIPVGKIFLRIGSAKINDKDCYRLTVDAFSSSFLSAFYDVRYTVNSFMDKASLLPVRFEKYRKVKGKVAREEIDFDHKRGEVKYKEEGDAPRIVISPDRAAMEGKIPATYKILPDSQDLLSSFYFLRLSDLRPGETFKININYGLRNWVMDVKIGEPYMKSIRRRGTFEVFDAIISSELNKFILGDAVLKICFTADSRRIPIEFKLGTGLGAFRGVIKQAPDANE